MELKMLEILGGGGGGGGVRNRTCQLQLEWSARLLTVKMFILKSAK